MRGLVRLLLRLSRWSVSHPRLTVASWSLVVAAALLLGVPHLELKTSNLDLIDADLPVVARFLAVAQELGTPNQLIVVLEGENPGQLRRTADEVAARLASAPGVAGVLARWPLPAAVALRLGLDPYFVSRDGGMAFVFVQPQDPRSQVETLEPLVTAARQTLVDLNLPSRGLQGGLTGVPAYALDDRDVVRSDTLRLSWLSLGLVAVVFASAFSSWRRPALAVLTLIASVVVALGLAALLPGHLNLVSAAFLSLLFGLGIDAGIHLVDRVEAERAGGHSEASAVQIAVVALTPGLLTSTLTTASALWALLAGGLRGFAELGLVAGNGLVVSLIASLTLLPALLVLLPAPAEPAPSVPLQAAPRSRIGAVLVRLQHPWVAGVAAAVVVAASLIPGPPFNSDYLDLEPRGSEAVRLEREMAARSDYSPQSLVFRVPDRNAATELVARLREEPSVGAIRSVLDLDLLETLSGDAAPVTLRRMVVAPDGELAVWVQPREQVWDPVARDHFVDRMLALDAEATGMPVLGGFLVSRSRRALLIGGSLGVLALLVWLWFDLRRPLLVALAAVPPLLTATTLQGAMAVLGLSWNPIAVIALPVVLGIAVDDGIHLVHRFLAEQGDLERSLRGTGRSVVLTSLTTAVAFGSLALAQHRGLASFGLIASLGVAIALGISILVLPRALTLMRNRIFAPASPPLLVSATVPTPLKNTVPTTGPPPVV